MFKKDTNIESYEGSDAFYSGTDEEYAEFLKNANVKMNDGEDAEPVENTRRINLNEAINIQGVIDRFKKTAGGIESGAKKIKESVVSKMDALKTKPENEEEDTQAEEESIADTVMSKVAKVAEKIDEIKENAVSAAEMPEVLSDVEKQLGDIQKDVANLTSRLDKISAMLDCNISENNRKMMVLDTDCTEIKQAVQDVNSGVNEIKQAVNSVSKLNDSLFDMKNTQLNTKNALSDIEIGFNRLKKKCVMGVTVLSVLSAIVIILEIILMLS